MRCSKHLMHLADNYVSNFGERLSKQYGFIADPSLPRWQNVQNIIGDIKTTTINSAARNMTCHNLLVDYPTPVGVRSLLGLGLNYCIKNKLNETTKNTFKRLREDIRRYYAFSIAPPEEDDDYEYIPKLYHKSTYKFPPASEEIETALNNFERELKQQQQQNYNKRKVSSNLPPTALRLIKFLRRHDIYMIIEADKNLGPIIMDRETYIKRCISEHLGNSTNYKVLSKQEADTKMRGLHYRLMDFLGRYYNQAKNWHPPLSYIGVPISKAQWQFLDRGYDTYTSKLARFRGSGKIHKIPWKMRPIVCCVGTWMNDWSKWLDYWLQQLKPSVPTYIRDSQQLLDELRELELPPNAVLCTADANSMYNNIDTDHAIAVISWWLDELEQQGNLPANFPIEAVKYAMDTIMRNNIFEFGDLLFLQLLGTAMGTSSAVMWATLYYGYHEVHTLIPKYGSSLLYFRRFVDDIFLIWLKDDTTKWDNFCKDVNYFKHEINGELRGQLTWEIEKPTTTIDFLDLTLTINNGRVTSKTYQKSMNLYLYIPPMSAHPRNCIRGTIYGLINRYYAQNTYRKDYVHFVRRLYTHLLERGWTHEYLSTTIIEASRVIEKRGNNLHPPTTPPTNTTTEDEEENRLFIHLQYHPDDIPRQRVRTIYDATCGDLFSRELGIGRPTIAYSRPPNIGDKITQAKLHQAPGKPASYYLGEYIQGLSP